MRSVRTSFVVAASVAAFCWSGISRADDVSSKKSTTTKSQTTSTTKSGATSGSGSTTGSGGSNVTSDSPGMQPSTSPPPSTTPSDTWSGTGTSTGSEPYGTGYGTSQPTTMPPDMTQQQTQPIVPPPTQTTTSSTTTTTAAPYDTSVGADKVTYDTRPNRPLLATGLGIFGATYGASVIVGAVSDRSYDDYLFIPVAGPWIDLAERPCGLGDCGSTEDWNQAMLIGSGILQGAGAGLALISLIVPEKHEATRITGAAKAKAVADANKPKVNVLPVTMRSGGGIGATGTF